MRCCHFVEVLLICSFLHCIDLRVSLRAKFCAIPVLTKLCVQQ